MSQKTYPECEKLSENREKIDHIMDFLNFLRKEGLEIGTWNSNGIDLEPKKLEGDGETLVAKFFGVDMAVVQKERQEIEKSLFS